nr:MAG TPA: hypothetical protein [Caudoviricetes sp.]
MAFLTPINCKLINVMKYIIIHLIKKYLLIIRTGALYDRTN